MSVLVYSQQKSMVETMLIDRFFLVLYRFGYLASIAQRSAESSRKC